MNDKVKTNQTTKGGKTGNGTPAWYLSKSRYPKRNGNKFTPYFCGADVFAAIASSIKNAKKSVDIICWGFDAGMPIIRTGSTWVEANAYGDILKKAAARGVKINLLIWYHTLGNSKQDNVIGEFGTTFRAVQERSPKTARDYPSKWITEVKQGKHPNLELRYRDIKDQGSIENEDPRGKKESAALSFPTDHQKSVMVDFGYEGCHGYIMGHNSLTTYWDTKEMPHNDPRREPGAKPFHDFSMKVEGPALLDLNHNFCESWDDNPKIRYIPTAAGAIPQVIPSNLKGERKQLESKINVTKGAASGQIVRTRPDKKLNGAKEKEIRRAYMQVAQHPRKYLLIVNQYFQYARWGRQIRHFAEEARKQGYAKELYVFIVTPSPELGGMVARTHHMANEFGVSDQVSTAESEFYDKKNNNQVTKKGKSQSTAAKITRESLAQSGIKSVFCSLKTQVKGQTPTEIYIHAKLTVIDDAFFTLGSANLNIRSLAVDSEINMLSDDINTAYNFRNTLFNRYTGGKVAQFGKNQSAKDYFDKFSKHSKKNEENVRNKVAVIGHVVPFSETRTGTAANVG